MSESFEPRRTSKRVANAANGKKAKLEKNKKKKKSTVTKQIHTIKQLYFEVLSNCYSMSSTYSDISITCTKTDESSYIDHLSVSFHCSLLFSVC